jgi:hypothetical protein
MYYAAERGLRSLITNEPSDSTYLTRNACESYSVVIAAASDHEHIGTLGGGRSEICDFFTWHALVYTLLKEDGAKLIKNPEIFEWL